MGRIVYIGNGGWRQKLDEKSTAWPKRIHHFTAEQIEGWPQFVKTGFRVLDNQLNVNEGYTDTAESSAMNGLYNQMYDEEEDVLNFDYFYVKKIMFIVSMVFICCCFGVLCIGTLIC